MVTETVVLGRDTYGFMGIEALHARILSSYGDWCRHISHGRRKTLWISEGAQFTDAFMHWVTMPEHSLGDALFFYNPDVATLATLQAYFRHMVYGPAEHFLPPEELAEVLLDDRKEDLVIGGIVDHFTNRLTLWRGSFEPLPVPFAAFAPSGEGVFPDFTQFRVTDYGQTVQLGPYEAATEALLYECDPVYRRRIAKERRASEQSFRAALRRLRKQRGLRREDFAPDLSSKTIARIERGEVLPEHIHGSTWAILTQKLHVKREEIETF
jgi:hypothetical protein